MYPEYANNQKSLGVTLIESSDPNSETGAMQRLVGSCLNITQRWHEKGSHSMRHLDRPDHPYTTQAANLTANQLRERGEALRDLAKMLRTTKGSAQLPKPLLKRVAYYYEDISNFYLKEAEKRPMKFTTLDSGNRQSYDSGMQRDTQENKPDYTLLPLEFLKRWAELMTRGAAKYGRHNWRLANSQEELDRFKSSALRHMMQWLEGDVTEDHATAVAFNIAAAEYVKTKQPPV